MNKPTLSLSLLAFARYCLLACAIALSMPAFAAPNDQPQPAKPIASIEQLRQEAEAGNAAAQYQLGVAYVRGEIVARDLGQARIWLERAAEQDGGEPSLTLGVYHNMGILGKRDTEQAFRWIEKAANHGSNTALFMLGNFHFKGTGTPQNIHLGIELLTKAANQGSSGAHYNLGIMHLNGESGPKDRIQARAWFIKAYEAGAADAPFMVAETYRTDDWKKFEAEVFKWMSIGAKAGHLKSQSELCYFYHVGIGTPKDHKKGFEQCLLVANRYPELKDPNARFFEDSLHNRPTRKEDIWHIYRAAYSTATALYNGEFVPRDCAAGRMWLTRVIEADDDVDITEIRAKAMRYLSLDYTHGCSVKRDDAEAKRLRDAADALMKTVKPQ